MEDNKINLKKIDKNHKISLVALSIFSVLVVVMWFLNFKNNLENSLKYGGDVLVSSQKNDFKCVGSSCQGEMNLSADNLELKFIDTDGDGISDWDELFIYGTSPYIEDTSGDGVTDYEAIFVYNIDPLCSPEQDCAGAEYQKDPQNINEKPSNGLQEWFLLLDGPDSENFNTDNLKAPDEFSPDVVDSGILRAMLLEDGMLQEDLDKISDEQLLNIYKEAFSSF